MKKQYGQRETAGPEDVCVGDSPNKRPRRRLAYREEGLCHTHGALRMWQEQGGTLGWRPKVKENVKIRVKCARVMSRSHKMTSPIKRFCAWW